MKKSRSNTIERDLSFPALLLKMEAFCAYQERCAFEVENKLRQIGCSEENLDRILSDLSENRYLDELRFATSFCEGKLRIKKWGRIKIRYQLIGKRISPSTIQKALLSIDQEEYFSVLFRLAEKKAIELSKEKDVYVRAGKLKRYLLSRGFEADLVSDVASQLINT